MEEALMATQNNERARTGGAGKNRKLNNVTTLLVLRMASGRRLLEESAGLLYQPRLLQFALGGILMLTPI
ncbi:hypothetical protein Pcinc_025748 [Petrolisthes cinctipes]|uniref:Uncharacterized protein n=1 Tax=Petrolisthes cinctipes TaxID=88211 RepID=A0AAE1F7B7_PETCI|nr:hypothetical protein Pcinc_025748 [Petrolisthes cinctipes]